MQTKFVFFTLIFLAYSILSEAQNRVVISDKQDQTPHESAVLDLISDDKGFLLPRMETDERNLIPDPAESLLIFNTETKCVETYIAGEWHEFWCKSETPDLGACEGVSPPEFYGYTYEIIGVGDQCWFAENLRTTRYRNGDDIPTGLSNNDWSEADSDAYSVYDPALINECDPGDDECVIDLFGIIYNGYAVADSRGICPEGWRVASDEDWLDLKDYLSDNGYYCGSDEDQVSKALASSEKWMDSATECNVGNDKATNNSTGFNALPGGLRLSSDGSFIAVYDRGHWWTSTELSETYMQHRRLRYNESTISRSSQHKQLGCYVRCIKED